MFAFSDVYVEVIGTNGERCQTAYLDNEGNDFQKGTLKLFQV